MNLNEAIKTQYGEGVEVLGRRPVAGGDINRAYALKLSDGSKIFMKANSRDRENLFISEACSLEAIRSTGAVRTPRVIAHGTEEDYSFLLLEYIESGYGNRHSHEMLGRELTDMHHAETSEFVSGGKYGFRNNNYLGSGVQINTCMNSWVDFFRECRLAPLFEQTESYFGPDERRRFDALIGRLDRYLPEPERPSLLHGDLWGGNYMIDKDGNPWLIDPASYVGHAEADLAMTELFGGFSDAFYGAYRETAGIDPGYRDRKDLYNLYHLLKHLKLFGTGYLGPALSVIARYA